MNSHSQRTGAVAIVLALAAAGCSRSAGSAAAGDWIPSGAPVQQQNFCGKLLADSEGLTRRYQAFKKAFDSEQNPLRKEAMSWDAQGETLAIWNDLYNFIGQAGEFKGWRGKPEIQAPYETPTGLGPVPGVRFSVSVCMMTNKVTLEKVPISIATSDVMNAGSTHIMKDSPLGQALASLDLQKEVVVSGNFSWAGPQMYTVSGRQPIFDKTHFLGANGMNTVDLSLPILMVRFTSIAQAH